MANPNFSVEKDMNLASLNCETLEVGGNLTVSGAIRPGTFTNRVLTLVDLAAAAAHTALTPAQSGTTVVIPLLSVGTQTISLPPAAPGLTYTFVQGAVAQAQQFQILCDTAVAENIFGNVDNNGTNLAIDGIQLNFLAASVGGDSVTLRAIGTGAGDVWAITQCPGSSDVSWS